MVLAMGPKICGFKPVPGRRIFRGDKIPYARFLKPSVPCRKILLHVKIPYSMKDVLVGKIHGHFSPSFSCFETRCWLLPEGSCECIRND
jgi:hypothetical protein